MINESVFHLYTSIYIISAGGYADTGAMAPDSLLFPPAIIYFSFGFCGVKPTPF